MLWRWGRLIFVSSVVGLLGSVGQVNYSASGSNRNGAPWLGNWAQGTSLQTFGPVETEMFDALTEDQRATNCTSTPQSSRPTGRIAKQLPFV